MLEQNLHCTLGAERTFWHSHHSGHRRGPTCQHCRAKDDKPAVDDTDNVLHFLSCAQFVFFFSCEKCHCLSYEYTDLTSVFYSDFNTLSISTVALFWAFLCSDPRLISLAIFFFLLHIFPEISLLLTSSKCQCTYLQHHTDTTFYVWCVRIHYPAYCKDTLTFSCSRSHVIRKSQI